VKESDLNDLAALSIAVAYCDVVVTEKQWAHVLRRSSEPRTSTRRRFEGVRASCAPVARAKQRIQAVSSGEQRPP